MCYFKSSRIEFENGDHYTNNIYTCSHFRFFLPPFFFLLYKISLLLLLSLHPCLVFFICRMALHCIEKQYIITPSPLSLSLSPAFFLFLLPSHSFTHEPTHAQSLLSTAINCTASHISISSNPIKSDHIHHYDSPQSPTPLSLFPPPSLFPNTPLLFLPLLLSPLHLSPQCI